MKTFRVPWMFRTVVLPKDVPFFILKRINNISCTELSVSHHPCHRLFYFYLSSKGFIPPSSLFQPDRESSVM